MTPEDEYRRRADDLLRAATRTLDLTERSRLIQQASHWHQKAVDTHDGRDQAADEGGDQPDVATA